MVEGAQSWRWSSEEAGRKAVDSLLVVRKGGGRVCMARNLKTSVYHTLSLENDTFQRRQFEDVRQHGVLALVEDLEAAEQIPNTSVKEDESNNYLRILFNAHIFFCSCLICFLGIIKLIRMSTHALAQAVHTL